MPEPAEPPDPTPAIEKIVVLFESDVAQHFPADSRGALVAYGLCLNIVHFAAGVLVLARSGLDLAAAPLRRAMIEFLIRLYWVVDSPEDAVDALNRDLQRIIQRLIAAHDAAGGDLPAEVIEIGRATMDVEVPVSLEENLLSARHITDHYGLTKHYLWWLAETQTAHPSLIAARLFMDDDDDSATVLRTEPNYVTAVPGPMICLVILFEAALAFNALLAGPALDGAAHHHRHRVRVLARSARGRQPGDLPTAVTRTLVPLARRRAQLTAGPLPSFGLYHARTFHRQRP